MQYRWCTGKRGSGSAPDRPRGFAPGAWSFLMGEIAGVGALLLLFYVCWLRFRVQVHRNRLDRRQYFEPRTGKPWIRPRSRWQ